MIATLRFLWTTQRSAAFMSLCSLLALITTMVRLVVYMVTHPMHSWFIPTLCGILILLCATIAGIFFSAVWAAFQRQRQQQ